MTTEEKIEVIRAFDEGKEVEFYDGGEWHKKETNYWNFKVHKYRVKPQPTRLEVANEFFEKKFGVKNAFNENTCIVHGYNTCSKCPAHKEKCPCESEKWWNTPYEENE